MDLLGLTGIVDLKGFFDLTIRNSREFSLEEVPDKPGINYFSIAGQYDPGFFTIGLLKPSHDLLIARGEGATTDWSRSHRDVRHPPGYLGRQSFPSDQLADRPRGADSRADRRFDHSGVPRPGGEADAGDVLRVRGRSTGYPGGSGCPGHDRAAKRRCWRAGMPGMEDHDRRDTQSA